MSEEPEHPKSVELPAPTGWPIITAFALTLLFAGLVTSVFVSIVGFLIGILGTIGWYRDVYPHPKHETVPVRPPEAGPAPIMSREGRVQHLKIGEQGHRVRIPVEVHPYSAGILGGLAGAAAMAFLACVWGIFAYGSVWYPINVLASVGVPELATGGQEMLKHFSLAGIIVGTIAHVSISVLVGLLYVVLLPMLPAKFEWFWGGLIAPLFWSGLIYASIGLIDPRLAYEIDWPWFVVCQVAFGVVGGYVVFKSSKVETLQALPFAARMGVEAGHEEEDKPNS